MTQCADRVPLAGTPGSAGLFSDLGELSSGSVKLRLQGHYRCRTVDKPFYLLDILDARGNEVIGEITFIPESDRELLASIGHSGGELIDAAKGKGHFGQALLALAPLARRHGLSDFTVAIPENNAAAIAAADKLRLARIGSNSGNVRFVVPA